jgi:hypothetical protein
VNAPQGGHGPGEPGGDEVPPLRGPAGARREAGSPRPAGRAS